MQKPEHWCARVRYPPIWSVGGILSCSYFLVVRRIYVFVPALPVSTYETCYSSPVSNDTREALHARSSLDRLA